jgi:branched-chain amino acid transport system permease protein
LSCLAAALVGIVYCLVDPTAFYVQVVIWVVLAAVFGSSLRFVMLVGELNLGTAAFYGIGAYSSGFMFATLHSPFIVCLMASALVGGIVALAFGYVTMRTSGAYFMLISFSLVEIFRLFVVESDFLGGNNGIVGLFVDINFEPYFPAFIVALSTVLVCILAWIEASPLGTIFAAIKSRESVARSVGINVLQTKVICLVIASVVASMAGTLQAFSTHVISPIDFGFMLAVFGLAYIKFGGIQHATGPVLGAIILTVASQILQDYGSYRELFFGVVIAVAMLLLPDGLIGRFSDISRLMRKREARRATE